MGMFRHRRAKDRVATRKRRRVLKSAILILTLVLFGALLDPSIIAPFGPTAARPERISATFTRCGQGRSLACVVDGDTIRLGARRVRLIGLDAPEIRSAQCPAELALANRSADRLVELVNQGEFDLIGHRFRERDSYGRDLRMAVRGQTSLGDVLIAEGLAKRYYGSKGIWC